MRRLLFVFLLFISIPFSSSAEELNAGFVQGLWYGTKVIVAGEPTRIYVALRNNTDHDLTGTVRFSDNGNRIGVSYISALPGRLVEAWVDWTPRYGEHSITATLSDVRVYEIGQTPETGEVEDTIAQDTLFVDYDTDRDGILNKEDPDDDNDTVSDVDEEKRGTDPLKANPIPKADDTDSTQEKENDGTNETRATTNETPRTTKDSEGPEGLEQYIPNPTVKHAIESVTNTINDTRTTLDAYRQNRADAIKEYFNDTGASPSPEKVASSTDRTATITRSRIEPKGNFFTATIDGGKALVSGFYSLILWFTSNALAHPALLELVLLIIVIYMVYRTARRYGRRRYDR